MKVVEQLYSAGVSVLSNLLPLFSGKGKVGRAVQGMTHGGPRLIEWAAQERDPTRQLIWIHAPSVGEGHQASAVIRELRRTANVQIVYTFTSPSAEKFASAVAADFSGFFPVDTTSTMISVLDTLQPDLVAFTKTEVWPNLVRLSDERGIPAALVSATLPPGSSRLRPAARLLLFATHRRLSAVGAISSEDAERYGRLGVGTSLRSVTGDTRFDQVAETVEEFPGRPPEEYPILVAGSTWPEDEDRLLPAFADIRSRLHNARLLIAPHEPTEAALVALERKLDALSLTHDRWGNRDIHPSAFRSSRRVDGLNTADGDHLDGPDVLVVDRVGILGRLYSIGTIAYVGGGFGRDGLHSVLEPAAYGLPVLFGPEHENAREAGELIEVGAGFAALSERALIGQLRAWLEQPRLRESASAAGELYVAEKLGASRRSANLLLDLLAERASDPT